MIYEFALICGGGLILYLIFNYQKRYHKHLGSLSTHSSDDNQAVKLASLSDKTLWTKLWLHISNSYKQIDSLAGIKLNIYIFLMAFLGVYLNENFIRGNVFVVVFIVEVAALLFGISWLNKREKNRFEESFPDALNLLSSAVGSGEGLMHGIIFVGKSLDGKVGNEFKRMGEQLKLGESPDTVFRKSCERFPYPSFQFFIITLRTSMARGGQLKEVMKRLNRIMFDARALDKKKYALTAEARMSAKIVAAIPFIFLFIMKYLSPENYEYVMFNPDGRPILYYVLISEFIGMFTIWLLMKGVR